MNKLKKITLKLPARVHIDVMDINKMTIGKTCGGGIGIAINMDCFISIEIINSEQDIINSTKHKLISYYINIMRKVLKSNMHFRVNLNLDSRLKEHNGMGSNALIQSGIVYGINYLLGSQLSKKELVNLVQENYYEEKEGQINSKVYCSGVAHNVMMFGGVCFVDDKGKLIYNKEFPKNIEVALLKADFDNIYIKGQDNDENIIKLRRKDNKGLSFKKKNSIIRNIIIPQLKSNEYAAFFESFKKIYKTENITILSDKCKIGNLNYNQLQDNLNKIQNLVIKMSSNSPYVFILTDKMEEVKKVCKKYDIDMTTYTINNYGIEVIERIE